MHSVSFYTLLGVILENIRTPICKLGTYFACRIANLFNFCTNKCVFEENTLVFHKWLDLKTCCFENLSLF